MISIVIPTFNNIKYLQLCIKSLQKNSYYKNEILLHINEGSDGTLEFVKKNKFKFSHSLINDGLCIGCNKVSKKSKFKYILYSHDDMYFCPNWDKNLIDEVNRLNTNKFYLSSMMINGDPKLNGHLNLSAGETVENFNEQKLLANYKDLYHYDFQGSTWAPHLIHIDMWNKVNGFSEEFSPGFGSDPDLNMKLWNEGVRIFKCLNSSKVYHFGSITIRKKNKDLFKNNSGSRANKIFLLKWKVSISFFKKYYLRSGSPYRGALNLPNKNWFFYFNLTKNKISLIYYLFISFFRKIN